MTTLPSVVSSPSVRSAGLNRAKRALEYCQSRPQDAARWSLGLLADPTCTPEELATAAWALGRAYGEMAHLDEARTAFDDGVRVATEANLVELAAEIRLSLASCLLHSGATTEAWAQLDLAETDLVTDGACGRLLLQRGLLSFHLGHLDEALAHLDQADHYLEHDVDQVARTRLLVNRGVVNTIIGNLAQAEADFLEARALAEQLGQQMMGAGAAQNLGFMAARKGDLPAAMRWFATARSGYEELGSPQRVMVTLESDLCTVLLSGGLHVEAVAAARRAANMAARTGNRLDEAEARLLLARACLAQGTPEEAEREAAQAAEIFRQSQRPPWAALADYVGLLAAARSTDPSPDLLTRAVTIAEHLAASGWRRESLEVRTFAGRTALALGRLDEARTHLGQTAEARHDGSSALRATAWLATAALRLADGDRAGAKQALSAGMAIVEEHRSSLGSTELRAHASINAAELAELGLELATEDGDPLEVLEWAERWHAGGLRVAAARPEPDSRLARALDELRQVHVSVMSGTTEPFDDDAHHDTDPDRRIAVLEREIRDLSRAAGGATESGCGTGRLMEPSRLRRALAGQALIEYFSINGDLHAVVLADDVVAVHSLGQLIEIETEIRKICSALGRLAYGRSSAASLLATQAALERMAASLDDRLVAKLGLPARTDVVIVPTGPLQGVPWPVLPSLQLRCVTVTPSGCLWATSGPEDQTGVSQPSLQQPGEARALLVCGTGLPGGEAEIECLRELYRNPTVLVGPDATVPAVTKAMEQADIVHLAAHGEFRADNPMFSSLQLHDGPLTVYDLESLSRAPTTVILPACDAARSSVRHGDELLGTAAALLQVGVRTVIAPVTVVPDRTVIPTLMVELHRQIQVGIDPARALVRARWVLQTHHDAIERATAASFVAIGTTTGRPGPIVPDTLATLS